MKRLVLLAILLSSINICFAQTLPQSAVTLQIVVDDAEGTLPDNVVNHIYNKLSNLLTKNGMQSYNGQNQFYISAALLTQTKDILPGPPTQIKEVMDLVLYIGDQYNELVFSSTTLTIQGVGVTPEKCYLNAIANVKANAPELVEFLQEGKKKIVNYYNQQASTMLKKAKNLSAKHNYDEAIWLLMSVPSDCESYDQVLQQAVAIYLEKLKYECLQNLTLAKTVWMTGCDKESAKQAAVYLSLIYPDSECYEDAKKLYEEIKIRLNGDLNFDLNKDEDEVQQADLVAAMRALAAKYEENL